MYYKIYNVFRKVLIMSDTKFAIEYDFSNQDGVVVIDHVKGVVYAKTCEEANKKFNMLVNKSKSYSSTFIKLGKPSFLGDSLIDIFTSYKVFRDGKIVKDLPIPEYVSENMNSIYKQMNNIDDKESLNEKYNVRTFRDIKRLHEAMTPENNDLQLIKSKWDDGQDDYGDIGDLRILQTIRKYYNPDDIECWYWRKDHSGDRPCYLVIETADGDEINFEENNGSLYQLD